MNTFAFFLVLNFLGYVFPTKLLSESSNEFSSNDTIRTYFDSEVHNLNWYMYDKRCVAAFSESTFFPGNRPDQTECVFQHPRCRTSRFILITEGLFNNHFICLGTYDENLISATFQRVKRIEIKYGLLDYEQIHSIALFYKSNYYYIAPGNFYHIDKPTLASGQVCIPFDTVTILHKLISAKDVYFTPDLNKLTKPIDKTFADYPMTFQTGESKILPRVMGCSHRYFDVCMDYLFQSDVTVSLVDPKPICYDIQIITVWTKTEHFFYSIFIRVLHFFEIIFMEIASIVLRVIFGLLHYFTLILNEKYCLIEYILVIALLYCYNPKFIQCFIIVTAVFIIVGFTRALTLLPQVKFLGDWLVERLKELSEFSP